MGQYCERVGIQSWIELNLIRLGTKYEKGNDLESVSEISNNIIIASVDSLHNREFPTLDMIQLVFY